MPAKTELITVRLNEAQVKALLAVARPNERPSQVLQRCLLEAAARKTHAALLGTDAG